MIKKLSNEKKSELIESAVAFIIVAGIFMSLIWAVYAAGNAFAEYKAAEARCESLQGEFGSMKCYKNGREI